MKREMDDREIDELVFPAHAAEAVDPAVVERAQRSIGGGVRAVRRLPSRWTFVALFAAIFAVVAVVGAIPIGMFGIRRLAGWQSVAIFGAIGMLVVVAAGACYAEMAPGAKRWVRPGVLPALVILGLAGLFLAIFHDYGMVRFLPRGVSCLKVGLMCAVPAALGIGLILRRGFVLNWTTAAVSAASLAGLAGVGALTLHCPNFTAPHVVVWHVGVVVVSVAVGWLLAMAARARR